RIGNREREHSSSVATPATSAPPFWVKRNRQLARPDAPLHHRRADDGGRDPRDGRVQTAGGREPHGRRGRDRHPLGNRRRSCLPPCRCTHPTWTASPSQG